MGSGGREETDRKKRVGSKFTAFGSRITWVFILPNDVRRQKREGGVEGEGKEKNIGLPHEKVRTGKVRMHGRRRRHVLGLAGCRCGWCAREADHDRRAVCVRRSLLVRSVCRSRPKRRIPGASAQLLN